MQHFLQLLLPTVKSPSATFSCAALALLPPAVCAIMVEEEGETMISSTIIEWLAQNLVGIAGIAGFLLSLFLAVSQFLANRLHIKAERFILIDANEIQDAVFLYVCLYNQTSLPFSLVDVYINAGHNYKHVPIERTVRTYYFKGNPGKRAPAGPVVLSPAFPVKFDSYGAEVFLLEVLRQHIDMQFLRPDSRNQEESPHKRFSLFRRLYKRLFPPRLILRTSRGSISIPVRVESVQGWDWLENYAVQKAGHEGKISFPL